MTRAAFAALLACAAAAAPAASQGVINLSCVEALTAVGEADLAGVFSFVPEKDSAAAFADLTARNPKALKKFVAKVEADYKAAKGISAWDKAVLRGVLGLYASPLADTLKKPGGKVLSRITELAALPALTLEAITAARRAGS